MQVWDPLGQGQGPSNQGKWILAPSMECGSVLWLASCFQGHHTGGSENEQPGAHCSVCAGIPFPRKGLLWSRGASRNPSLLPQAATAGRGFYS